ncbi:MAG: hypothetical protein QOK39_2591 [Acidimicrobiaceae bacterium]|nr:hypothetical protein [Acidimicrobiaceae bacterium]
MGKTLYSVAWRLIGPSTPEAAATTVEVFVPGAIVKTWTRVERGRRTDWADYPPGEVAFFMAYPGGGAAAGPPSWASLTVDGKQCPARRRVSPPSARFALHPDVATTGDDGMAGVPLTSPSVYCRSLSVEAPLVVRR